jgi:hypothetical protein
MGTAASSDFFVVDWLSKLTSRCDWAYGIDGTVDLADPPRFIDDHRIRRPNPSDAQALPYQAVVGGPAAQIRSRRGGRPG